tara:strand:+ start:389 stop:940 length:552 start_codon:yes stop_codon:yes gene_type:complete
MVKNFGGNRGKKVARKHMTNNFNNKLRLAQEEGEVYGCVLKLLGNGMCHVNCLEENNSSKTRLCIIRNKFRGRGKRDNTLSVGTYVLVGLRSWETVTDNKIEKCDLISVYNSGDFEKVKNSIDKPWNTIKVEIGNHNIEKNDSDAFIFDDKNDELIEELENNIQNDKQETFVIDDEDINIDDI